MTTLTVSIVFYLLSGAVCVLLIERNDRKMTIAMGKTYHFNAPFAIFMTVFWVPFLLVFFLVIKLLEEKPNDKLNGTRITDHLN